MKKLFIALLMFVASVSAQAFQCSPVNPYSSQNVTAVCHTAYETFVDNELKIPLMVHYEIAPNHEQSCNIRTGTFKPDPLLNVSFQGSSADYAASGYDIGHLFAAEDGLFDPVVEHETFYFDNANPQAPAFNRGKWKQLEGMVRNWSVQSGHILDVYTGPIKGVVIDYAGSLPVPGEFYKVVVDTTTNEAVIFRMLAPRSDLIGWHGTTTNLDVVTSLKEVPLNLHQWSIRSTMWPKASRVGKTCN